MIDLLQNLFNREPHRRGLNPLTHAAYDYIDEPYQQPTAGFGNEPHFGGDYRSEQPPTFRMEDIIRMVSEIQNLMDSWSMNSQGGTPFSAGRASGGQAPMSQAPMGNIGGGVRRSPTPATGGMPTQTPQHRPPAPGGRDVAPGNPYVHQSPYGF